MTKLKNIDQVHELFAETFYEQWDAAFDFANDLDSDNPTPWGCAWLDSSVTLTDDMTVEQVKELAKNYFESVKEDILQTVKAEAEAE